jgi:hypothetical protein
VEQGFAHLAYSGGQHQLMCVSRGRTLTSCTAAAVAAAVAGRRWSKALLTRLTQGGQQQLSVRIQGPYADPTVAIGQPDGVILVAGEPVSCSSGTMAVAVTVAADVAFLPWQRGVCTDGRLSVLIAFPPPRGGMRGGWATVCAFRDRMLALLWLFGQPME